MAVWHGKSQTFAACWGWRNGGRTQSPIAGGVVRHTFALVSQGGQPMKTPKGKAPAPTKTQGAYGEQLSFLPTPEFCPILPPPNSAAAVALDDLLAQDLTQIDWLRDGKGWRLAAAVKELDYLGWEPKSVLVQCVEWKNPIARYSLPTKAKQAAHAMRNQRGCA